MDIVEKEYARSKELKREDVKQLLTWLESQPHLPGMTEHEVMVFLDCSHGNNELAKIRIDNYFTMRTEEYGLFGPKTEKKMELVCQQSLCYPLSQKTPEEETIVFIRIADKDSTKFIFEDHIKTFDLICAINVKLNGTKLQAVVDAENLVMGYIVKFDLLFVKKLAEYFDKALPIRFKGLHIINSRAYVNAFVTTCKPFFKKDVTDKIHIHNTIEELTKFIPLECLPSDYGGKEESIDVLSGKMIQLLHDNADFMKRLEGQLVDESKRPEKYRRCSDMFGKDGTFKKLEID